MKTTKICVRLDEKASKFLDLMAFYAKNVHNEMIYRIKSSNEGAYQALKEAKLAENPDYDFKTEEFKAERRAVTKVPTAFDMQKWDVENRKFIWGTTFQGIPERIYEGYKSFFSNYKRYMRGDKNYENEGPPKPPSYKDKRNGRSTLRLKTGNFVIKPENDYHIAILSKPPKAFVEAHPEYDKYQFSFRLPSNVNPADISILEIKPEKAGQVVICVVYKTQPIEEAVCNDLQSMLSIDLGMKNLVTLVDHKDGESWIVRGSYVLAENGDYNVQMDKLKKQLARSKDNRDLPLEEKKFTTKKMERLSVNRDNFMQTFFKQLAHKICQIAKSKKLQKVVLGYNKGWKNEVNMRKKTNRRFVSIPYDMLKQNLNYLAKEYGLAFFDQGEAYTSCMSYLDQEPPLPKDKELRVGKRTKRGLFRSNQVVDGKKLTINSDVNGAAQIGVKHFLSQAKKGQKYDYTATWKLRHTPNIVEIGKRNPQKIEEKNRKWKQLKAERKAAKAEKRAAAKKDEQ